jgi:hypothetical protein
MRSVTFKPWVGSRYEAKDNRFGVKLMVLGESHYSKDGAPDPQFTRSVIKTFGVSREPGRGRTFTKLAKLLLDIRSGEVTDAKRSEVWRELLFYNFVQEYVGSSARQRPTSNMWVEGKKPLLQVLDRYSPDLILVLGKALEHHVRPLEKCGIPASTTVCYVQHPAAAFVYDVWCQKFQLALRKARRKCAQ